MRKIFSKSLIVIFLFCMTALFSCDKVDTPSKNSVINDLNKLQLSLQDKNYTEEEKQSAQIVIDLAKSQIERETNEEKLSAYYEYASSVVLDREILQFINGFDLSEKSEIDTNINGDVETDRIVVILKQSAVPPAPELRHFGLENAAYIEYEAATEDNLNNPLYRMIVTIYLRECGLNQVCEAINWMEGCAFVKYAGPAYKFSGGFD